MMKIAKLLKLNLKECSRTIKNQDGMTLIEILIVLAILGGVMAMLADKIFQGKDKAAVRQARIMLSTLSDKINLYQGDCNKYPESLENLSVQDASCPNWGPTPYVRKSELTDPWNHPFIYSLENGNPVLKCLGKDGKEGGTGFDQDITFEE